MKPETMIGYLVALAVPIWLLVEGAIVSRRSPKQAAKKLEAGRVTSKPAPAGSVTARAHTMRLADSRKSA